MSHFFSIARTYVEVILPATSAVTVSYVYDDAHVIVRGNVIATAVMATSGNNSLVRLNSANSRYIFRGTIDGDALAQIGLALQSCTNVKVTHFDVSNCQVDAELLAIGINLFDCDGVECAHFAIRNIVGLELSDPPRYSRGIQSGVDSTPTYNVHCHHFTIENVEGDHISVQQLNVAANALFEDFTITHYQWRGIKIQSPGVTCRRFTIDGTNDANKLDAIAIFNDQVLIEDGVITATQSQSGVIIRPSLATPDVVLRRITCTLSGDKTDDLQYGLRVTTNIFGPGKPEVTVEDVTVTCDSNYHAPVQVTDDCVRFNATGLEAVGAGSADYLFNMQSGSVTHSSFSGGGQLKLDTDHLIFSENVITLLDTWVRGNNTTISNNIFDGDEQKFRLIDVQGDSNLIANNTLVNLGNIGNPVEAIIIRLGADNNVLSGNVIDPKSFDGTRDTTISNLGSGNIIG